MYFKSLTATRVQFETALQDLSNHSTLQGEEVSPKKTMTKPRKEHENHENFDKTKENKETRGNQDKSGKRHPWHPLREVIIVTMDDEEV